MYSYVYIMFRQIIVIVFLKIRNFFKNVSPKTNNAHNNLEITIRTFKFVQGSVIRIQMLDCSVKAIRKQLRFIAKKYYSH